MAKKSNQLCIFRKVTPALTFISSLMTHVIFYAIFSCYFSFGKHDTKYTQKLDPDSVLIWLMMTQMAGEKTIRQDICCLITI